MNDYLIYIYKYNINQKNDYYNLYFLLKKNLIKL